MCPDVWSGKIVWSASPSLGNLAYLSRGETPNRVILHSGSHPENENKTMHSPVIFLKITFIPTARPASFERPACFSSQASRPNAGHLNLLCNGLSANTCSVHRSVQSYYERRWVLQNYQLDEHQGNRSSCGRLTLTKLLWRPWRKGLQIRHPPA